MAATTPDPTKAALTRVARDAARIVRSARSRGVSTADAEDALQTGLERALTRVDQLREGGRADAWVARIVRNALVDGMRSRRAHLADNDVDHLASPDECVIDCWCVLAQMEALGRSHREILQRVVIEGRSLADAAAQLGLTPNNATVRLHRARVALRAQLAAHCGTTTARSCADCGCRERGCCPEP